jgi:HEAT repeat protein
VIFAAIIITASLVALIVVLIVSLILRRLLLARDEAHERGLYDRLRPLVAGWLADPTEPIPYELRELGDRRTQVVMARLLARYGSMLRGDARDRLTTFVASQGYVEAAIEEARSRRSWRRGRAARMLGDFGSARAVRTLATLVVRDPDPGVRLAAARALGRIDDYKSAAALLIALPSGAVPAGVVAQSLLNLGDHAFHALVSACADEDLPTRRMACRLLGLVGAGTAPDARRAAQIVLRARGRDDADAAVRAAAVGSLARLGDTTCGDVVRAALDAPDRTVRLAGALATTGLYLRDLAPRLAEVVGEELARERPDWLVVRTAAHAWGTLAEELDPTVVAPAVRVAALPFLREAAALAHRELVT